MRKEVKNMNRKAIIGIGLSLAFAVLAASISTALAVTTFTEHVNAGGTTRIFVPGHPEIMLVADHGDISPYGPTDRIQIYVSANPTGFGGPFRPVVAYEDNPDRIVFSQSLSTGIIQNVVKPGHIQVLRVGENNTIMVHWNIPLVAPATTPSGPYLATPAVTIPPGKLVFQGYGDAKIGSGTTIPYPPSGWSAYVTTPTYYYATVTFFCQGWDYKWLPVAEYAVPNVITDRTWSWTGP
jgi:hypothetical protein